jgi:hypothetical protein
VEQELGPWKAAPVERLILHWTAGREHASALEREHYHWLIQQDLTLVKGRHPDGGPPWAQHTRLLNTGSLGISLCGMAGATTTDWGAAPITAPQLQKLVLVAAVLCQRYRLAISERTVLSHAEVGRVYGITQNGKWDISIWPGRPEIQGAAAVGHELRRLVAAALHPPPAVAS